MRQRHRIPVARGLFVATVASIVVTAGAARAQEITLTGPLRGEPPPPELDSRALGTVDMWAGYARALAAHGAAPTDVGGAGLAARVFYGHAIAAGAGLEFALGAASSPREGDGFAGTVALFPLGVAVLPTNDSVLALLPGIGFDGTTVGEPGALVLPVEARVAFDVCSRLRLTADVRPTWVPAERARKAGARDVPWTDEITARLAVRGGRKWEDPPGRQRAQGQTSGGYFLRAELAERMHSTYVGASIGFELVGGAIFRRWPPW